MYWFLLFGFSSPRLFWKDATSLGFIVHFFTPIPSFISSVHFPQIQCQHCCCWALVLCSKGPNGFTLHQLDLNPYEAWGNMHFLPCWNFEVGNHSCKASVQWFRGFREFFYSSSQGNLHIFGPQICHLRQFLSFRIRMFLLPQNELQNYKQNAISNKKDIIYYVIT